MVENTTRQHSRPLPTSERDQAVTAFCRLLAARYRPLRITLFGSHAAGTAHPDSDVDLLVEMEHVDSALTAAADILKETKPRFDVDLLVRTPQQVQARIRMGDSFMTEIVNTGKVVYESTDR